MNARIILMTLQIIGANMNIYELKGTCHAHITIADDSTTFICPKGWKIAIIVLNNQIKTQKDVIITRHFGIGSTKTPTMNDIYDSVKYAIIELKEQGINILRAKLEHETLPSLEPCKEHYRECHLKFKHPKNEPLITIPGYVASRNIMEEIDTHSIAFLSARYYAGSLILVDTAIDIASETIKILNPKAELLSVHKESIVFDTNPEMDNWWA